MPSGKRPFIIDYRAAMILPVLPEKMIDMMEARSSAVSKRRITFMTRQLVAAYRYSTYATLVLISATMSQSDAQSSASVVDFGTYNVVKLVFGVNAVGFGPAGTQGTVLLGWRENFNAHGFGVGTFYLKAPKGTIPTGFQNDDVLGLVTLWNDVKGSKEALTVATSGGADCILHDFRLLISTQHKPSLLVLADREMGETFVDEERVTFKIYTLTQNIETMPGRPTFYFDLTDQRVAKRKYCDVEKAFQDELGLGDYRNRLR
jgi:hypothetical protein